jgi:hypothetical protein
MLWRILFHTVGLFLDVDEISPYQEIWKILSENQVKSNISIIDRVTSEFC